jgi:hypothetical protein
VELVVDCTVLVVYVETANIETDFRKNDGKQGVAKREVRLLPGCR